MTAAKRNKIGVRAMAVLLAGTMLSGLAGPAFAQGTAPAPAAAAPAAAQAAPAVPQAAPATAVAPPVQRVIKSLRVEGAQRLESDTVLSYTRIRPGQSYTNETLDQAIRDLYASDLLADVQIIGAETGDLVVRIRENPIINRIVFEGNRRLKEDKILKEIKLAPRQIFTRTAVRNDVDRIVELYRRQGRFAAVVEPKMVELDQNRVDIVFEVQEGPKSRVRQINIIGNEQFSDGTLRGEMATKQARIHRIFSSGTSYDQDRLAYDQQKLRQFYLTQGYADFRVVSAVAELTPDKRDFIITYVVEEGPRYRFGDVTVDSAIRDLDGALLARSLPMKKGDWYNAKQVEDSVDLLSETAGLLGYAFADVRPEFQRDRDTLTMSLNFNIGEANRTYVERIDITGNRQTQDEVIRREFRIAEGDPFNSFLVKRSQDRINSLGFFQDRFEIERKEGSSPDRIVLVANVEERSTGELTLSAGFSSLERFILQASVRQRNFRGKGQDLRLSVDYSSYSKSIEAGFTEPYLFDRNIALGGTVFRRDYNSFSFSGNDRRTTYQQISTGFQLVAGVPLTEYWTIAFRYGLTQDNVTLDRSSFYSDNNGNGVLDDNECSPLLAGRYLCEAIGNRLTSAVGFSLIYDSLNSRLRPTAGQRLTVSGDFAGLGGDVRYLRARVTGDRYFNLGSGFIFSINAEAGYIHSLERSPGPGIDPVRITDRWYLGEPQFRGFDIRGVGPRVQRIPYIGDPNPNVNSQALVTDREQIADDPLGGRAYYLARAEVEIPLGAAIREMGIRPSVYVQAGALWGITRPLPTIAFNRTGTNADGSSRLEALRTNILDANGNIQYIFKDPTTQAQSLTPCQFGTATAGVCPTTGTANGIFQQVTEPFLERFVGDSARPRISVGFGVNWNSPFGPLRIDIAHALLVQPGDDTKLFTFNVGTQF